MIREIRASILRMLVITALLWAQSAMAQHSTDHLWHEVTEVCDVLLTADHSKFLNTSAVNTVPKAMPEVFSGFAVSSLQNRTCINRKARSPPL